MCQRRPADPTDPGDAADLSIMGYLSNRPGISPAPAPSFNDKDSYARVYENQLFLNQASWIAWIKVNL
jgi:hypothetical protein